MIDPSCAEAQRSSGSRQRSSDLRQTCASDPQSPRPDEVERLVSELQFRQSELEVQNRKLQDAQRQLEAYRDRYIDLYDFAPLGYVTLDQDGYVQEINLAGAKLLGGAVGELVGYSFADLVVAADRAAFAEHVRKCCGEHQDVTVELGLIAKDGRLVAVQLHSIPVRPLQCEGNFCKTAITDITERKRAEDAVQAERNLLRTLIDNLPDSIYVKDTQGRFVAANLATARLMGVTTPSDLLGKSDGDFYPEKVAAGYSDDERELLRSGEPLLNKDEPHLDLLGRLRSVLTTKVPLKDSHGAVVGLVGVSRDITEHKQTEEALRASEEQLRMVMRASSTGWWDWDLNTNVFGMDDQFQSLLGVSPTESLTYEGIRAHLRPEDRPRLDQTLARILADAAEREVEVGIDWPDGSVHWALFRGRTLHDAAGVPLHLMGVSVDVTDRHVAEEALRESEQFYRTLIETLPVTVVLADPQGRVSYISPAGEELFGLAPGEGLRTLPLDWIAPEYHEVVRQRMQQVLVNHCTQPPVEYQMLKRNGELIWAQLASAPVLDQEGRLKGVITVCTDITERKRAELELAASQALAEQANRAKDHFLAVLSHELRTPLTPVVMGLGMLQERTDLDPLLRETLDMVRRHLELETRLIDDLLDVSRIAQGKIELERSVVALQTIIERAAEVCRADIEMRALEFGVDLGTTAPYWVEADPARLEQVFWNLLKNAIKFTPHGGCVGIRCRPDGAHVIIEVNDSGIGIEPAALSRVFDAFEQVEQSITRRFGGLGLGLAICKALVEMHGGTIEAHSAGRDQGATFRVRLPLATPAGAPEVCLPPAAPRHAVRPLHILLVEDHGVTAKLMRMVLTADGHTVETAGDVATALELAGQQPFDLLVSDLGLPDGSGHDLMRRLREGGRKFPGIAMSGYGQEEDIQRSYEAGFIAHLTKPASREAIKAAIALATAGEMRPSAV